MTLRPAKLDETRGARTLACRVDTRVDARFFAPVPGWFRQHPSITRGLSKRQSIRGSPRRYNKTTLKRLLIWVFGVCTATGMAAETASFSKTLYPVFEEAGCPACHNPDGVASATRLQFPEQSAPADRVEAFGKSLVVLVDPKNPANSLLLRKPTARVAHAGGQRIQPGSPEEAALLTWIDAPRATQG